MRLDVAQSIQIINECIRYCLNSHSLSEDLKTSLFQSCVIYAKFLVEKHRNIRFMGEELPDFITYVAEELYLKVTSGNKAINYWQSALYFTFLQAISDYRRLFGASSVDNRDDAEIVFDPRYASRYVKSIDYRAVLRADMIMELQKLFKGAREWINHYKGWSSKTGKMNARTSFILSVKYRHFVPFRLNRIDEMMCRFVYNRFKFQFQSIISQALAAEIIDDDRLATVSWIQSIFANEDE